VLPPLRQLLAQDAVQSHAMCGGLGRVVEVALGGGMSGGAWQGWRDAAQSWGWGL
jgi:hypothetical protein